MRIWIVMGALVAGSLLGSGAAAADPDPAIPDPQPAEVLPVETVNAPLPVADPFAAASQQSKADPGGALAQLLSGNGGSPAAAIASGVGLDGAPVVNPLANVGSLMAHNFRMPADDEVSPYVLQTDVPAGPFARVDAFKGLHAMLHGALGRMPGSELGQPLPGTAPPPGTAIPAGIEGFLPAPVAPILPAAPVLPLILPGG